MGAGELDQRVTLRSYTQTPDGMGGQVRAAADFATTPTVWAKVQPVRGSEKFQEERTAAVSTYLITIRYRDDVNEGHFVRWRGSDYNIRNVKRTSGRELNLVLECERGVPA